MGDNEQSKARRHSNVDGVQVLFALGIVYFHIFYSNNLALFLVGIGVLTYHTVERPAYQLLSRFQYNSGN